MRLPLLSFLPLSYSFSLKKGAVSPLHMSLRELKPTFTDMNTRTGPGFLVCFFFSIWSAVSAAAGSTHPITQAHAKLGRTYIVHVSRAQRPTAFASAQTWYASTLASVQGVALQDFDEAQNGPIYSYSNAFHGFAARLTASQAQALKQVRGVLSVLEDGMMQLQTTRTPEFLGLNRLRGVWPASDFGKDVIIGVMDSGIWPERESFNDEFIGQIPARWKGGCESMPGFSASLCNRKLIGARAFSRGYEMATGPLNLSIEYSSARDSEGHGTHTASTAAGNFVMNASLFGEALGTSRGMAPHARIAAYKVCWKGGCTNSDILAAFEQAILDGVDIISLSVGGSVIPYFMDPIAIGSFGAVQKGILVSASAGNSGPNPQSVGNVSPWIITVGASTLDRDFPAIVVLGNSVSYTGASLYHSNALGESQLPLIYAGDAGLTDTNGSVGLCMADMLDPALVKGKIVVCDRGVNARTAKGMAVHKAGGAGMILANSIVNGEELIADSHVLPALLVGYSAGMAIKDFIAGTQRPTASIRFVGTTNGVKPAPVMAVFSSRGPNSLTPEILKPDVTAPGINILAAWTDKLGPTEQPSDDRVVDFNIMSGTSMSCPHVSGLAALLKAAHPEWSPAAIKSALMTTAYDLDNTGSIMSDGEESVLATPFAYGSGHVYPNTALDPGLVYDLNVQDYVDFLCGLNLPTGLLTVFTRGEYNCSSGGAFNPSNLNYPSLSFVFNQGANATSFRSTVSRTVTNVGEENSIYTVTVNPPPGVRVTVEPSTLTFSTMSEKKTYTVTCETGAKLLLEEDVNAVFGSLVWSDAKERRVRSPIAFTWQA